jgi:hypothetical protein
MVDAITAADLRDGVDANAPFVFFETRSPPTDAQTVVAVPTAPACGCRLDRRPPGPGGD